MSTLVVVFVFLFFLVTNYSECLIFSLLCITINEQINNMVVTVGRLSCQEGLFLPFVQLGSRARIKQEML